MKKKLLYLNENIELVNTYYPLSTSFISGSTKKKGYSDINIISYNGRVT